MEERYLYFCFWTLIWLLCLNLPPGSTQITSSYRLNFTHGLLSCIVAILCILGYVNEAKTTVCTMSYLLVDLINNTLNDFVWQVPSYHKPLNRRVEYFHHILCLIVGGMSEYSYRDYCTFTYNPFVKLMLGELSTPFLIAWRATKSDILGALFVISFFLCRLVFHGYYFVPECIARCKTPGNIFGYSYMLMNIFFFVSIIMKLTGSDSAKPKVERKVKE